MSQDASDADSEKRKWNLYDSAAYRVLYLGEDPPSFVELLHKFQIEQPGKFEKLNGIASRLLFVEQLQYLSENRRLREELFRGYSYNVDRLCTYLGATCLEIAATREEYRSFPDRLNESCRLAHRPGSIDSAMADLVDATSTVVIEKRLLKWVKRLHDQDYLDEAGLGRAFKRLFDNLPVWLGTWLSNVYFIEKVDVLETLMDSTTSKWMHASSRERCRTIADYLYRQVRNQYTHTVYFFPTMDRGTLSIVFGQNRYFFNRFYPEGDWSKKLNLSVGLKEGFTESDVVRLIAVYVVRSWLGIADGEAFLERYWQYAHRRNLLYELLNELHSNLDMIQWWGTRHLYWDQEESHTKSRVGMLASQTAENVLSRIDDLDLRFLDHELRNYLDSIQIINDEVASFEANLQQEEGDTRHLYVLEAFVRTLMEHPQLRGVIDHMRTVESIVCHVMRLPIPVRSF